ncbi:hypothetical protein [Streptomyces anulatus]|uniref:hypothetical protein n=1 Tax=Streptomyces anulatus TaxID=1892 RepID=UPI0036363263
MTGADRTGIEAGVERDAPEAATELGGASWWAAFMQAANSVYEDRRAMGGTGPSSDPGTD